MHTVASAMSASVRHLSDALYAETRRLLEVADRTRSGELLPDMGLGADVDSHDTENRDVIPLEQIQALLLLAHYEMLCVSEHKAMITAGQIFRMVQLTRLYDLDREENDNGKGIATSSSPHHFPSRGTHLASPSSSFCNDDADSVTGNESFVDAEERRRTFWLAFSLDRFLSSRDELPLTLHDDMMCVRLPAPEYNFQQNQPARVGFLSEMMDTSTSTLSVFAECMILVTLHGRCITHRRRTLASSRSIAAQEAQDFWTRQEELSSTIERRIKLLEQSSPFLAGRDPMALFTHTLARSSVIHLNGTIDIKRRESTGMTMEESIEGGLKKSVYEGRAYDAAFEVVRLTRSARTSISCFKVRSLSVR